MSTEIVMRVESLPAAEREAALTALIESATTELKRAVALGESPAVLSAYKDQAAAIADLTKRLNLSKDSVLDSQILQRRAENALGIAIRDGQLAGTVRSHGKGSTGGAPGVRGAVARSTLADAAEVDGPTSPYAYAKHSELYGNGREGGDGILVLAEARGGDFEDALSEAREEGNVSRANVARKVKAKTRPVETIRFDRTTGELVEEQPKSVVRGPRRKHLAMLDALVHQLDGVSIALDLIDKLDPTVTPDEAQRIASELTKSVSNINRIIKLLKGRA